MEVNIDIIEAPVSKTTNVHRLATYIFRSTDEGKELYLNCIGAFAVHQAVKAIGTANGLAASRGYYFSLLPTFSIKKIEENVERTEIKLKVLTHRIGE